MQLELKQVRVPSLQRVAPCPCLRCLAECEPARAPAGVVVVMVGWAARPSLPMGPGNHASKVVAPSASFNVERLTRVI